MKIRLDEYLVQKKITDTRSKAKQLILQGKIKVSGKILLKPSLLINPSEPQDIHFQDVHVYVGRGAYKLKFALEKFEFQVQDKIAADIGASTGGFSEILLQNGIKRIYAIDVGHNQLAEKVKADARVINMEKTNIKDLTSLPEICDFAVVDLSFISLTKVLKKIKNLLKENGSIIALIKPQFESDSSQLNKNGVVKPEFIDSIINNFQDWLVENDFRINQIVESPIKGKEGNLEFLALITFSL